MKTESALFNSFTENRASNTFTALLAEMGFVGNPVDLFVDALSKIGVTAIYSVKQLFIVNNIVDIHVTTTHGNYSMNITEFDVGFNVRIVELENYKQIELFKLSKAQPSGLPDGV